MTSRVPATSLRAGSAAANELSDFLEYLNRWEDLSKDVGGFLSDSIATILRVTISSTLSLPKYTTEKLGMKYLMTA